MSIMSAAFTGVEQVNPLDDTSELDDSTSPYGLTLTPSTNDQLLVLGAGDDDDTANNRTPTGNTIELIDNIAGDGAGDYGEFLGYYIKAGASGDEVR